MFQTKDEAQGKLDRRLDRKQSNRPKKFIPLIDRDFNDLVSLSDQLEWVKLRRNRKEQIEINK